MNGHEIEPQAVRDQLKQRTEEVLDDNLHEMKELFTLLVSGKGDPERAKKVIEKITSSIEKKVDPDHVVLEQITDLLDDLKDNDILFRNAVISSYASNKYFDSREMINIINAGIASVASKLEVFKYIGKLYKKTEDENQKELKSSKAEFDKHKEDLFKTISDFGDMT